MDYLEEKEIEKEILENLEKNNEIERKNLISEAEEKLEAKEYDKAIQLYARIIELRADAMAYNNRGNAYRQKGDLENAIEDYNKAIDLDENYIDAYNNRGFAYYEKRDYQKAIEDYSKAIKLDENYAPAYGNRGNIYYVKRDFDKAIDDYNNVIELDENCTQAYNNRGATYYQKGDLEKALKDYNKAIQLDKKCKYAYIGIGDICDAKGDKQSAIHNYNKAIDIDRNYLGAFERREKIYRDLGDYTKANEDYIKINEQKIDKEFAYYIIRNIDNRQEARSLLEFHVKAMEIRKSGIHREWKQIGHYSTLQSINYLVKKESKDNVKDKQGKEIDGPKLRLNNVVYMNDPEEGKVFIDLLKSGDNREEIGEIIDKLYGVHTNGNRMVLNNDSYVYLTSFSHAIDKLPMWVQYSDNGQGCCYIFNEDFFDKDEKNVYSSGLDDMDVKDKFESNDVGKHDEEEYCLYDVMYVDNEGKIKLSGQEQNDIEEKINEIREALIGFKENINDDVVKKIIVNILDQVRFLFKSVDYEHEKEARLIKVCLEGEKITGENEGFRVPHRYIEVKRELRFDEIILGPKVTNQPEIAAYLYYTKKTDKVTTSSIKYQ